MNEDEDEESYRDKELKSITGDSINDTMSQFDTQLQSLIQYHSKFAVSMMDDQLAMNMLTGPLDQEHDVDVSSNNNTASSTASGSSVGSGGGATSVLDEIAMEEMALEQASRQLQQKIETQVQFTGEEHYGRFVDLNHLYQMYINLPMILKMNSEKQKKKTDDHSQDSVTQIMDYLTYLSQLSHFSTIENGRKCNDPYLNYLKQLYDYLVQFYQKTQPLSDLDQMLNKTNSDFELKWNRGDVPGYETISNTVNQPRNLTQSSEQQVNDNNDNNAKKKNHEDSSKEEQKGATTATEQGSTNTKEQKKRTRHRRKGKKINLELMKQVAKYEVLCSMLVGLLSDVIESTMIQLEKKQVRTWEEIQNDLAREEMMEEKLGLQTAIERRKEGDEDDSIGSSNPLNLPLGWDGKPIPFWLYKFYGLNQEFTCEICGNYSYWGPRAFEKHFQEWRHANGMRCLRIPNTRHFHQITKIADARALWDKIKKEEGSHVWKSDDMEEYEDEEGNVFNKKTYMDLKRQGLIK